MNIYKLTYENKEQALADLKAKGILVKVEFNGEKHEAYGQGVHAVVNIGKIMIVPPVMEGMEIVTPPVYADGYHYDVMSENEYDFGSNLVVVKKPKYCFAGMSQNIDIEYKPNFITLDHEN